MRHFATMTSRGRVTIPKEVRDQLGLKPRDKIRFFAENGQVRLERLPHLEELAGNVPSLASLGLNMTTEGAIKLAAEEHAESVYDQMRNE